LLFVLGVVVIGLLELMWGVVGSLRCSLRC